jgi:hypothetical protein
LRRSIRPVAAALAAVAVVIAIATTGCTADVATTTTAPTTSPTPTPTHPAAPVSRVASTCEELMPDSVRALFRLPVEFAPIPPSQTPAVYADERAGSLICRWSSSEMLGEDAPMV